MSKKERVVELLGEVTNVYTDSFGLDWNQYYNSKLYFIQNVGSDREAILKELAEIEVVDSNGVFGYIEVAIHSEEQKQFVKDLSAKHGCYFVQDTG